MPGRIVLYGATGYTGRLTAQALLTAGARPVLAGRDRDRLRGLAERLSPASGGTPLDTAVVAGPGGLRDLIGAGDVLVSTAGPFMKIGQAAVTAAVDAGAVYLDSTGEPPFIRQVFEEHGRRAERTGAVLLTAFGYDYVPGNLAGALALEAAGPAATRVDVGYFVRGDVRRAASAGTLASTAGVLFEPGYGFRGGRIIAERSAARMRSFQVGGKILDGFSIGGSEHFALPALRRAATGAGGAAGPAPLTEVGVYLSWAGGMTRIVHYGSALASPLGRIPLVRWAIDAQARWIQRTRAEPDAAASIRSDIVAVAADARGTELASVHLTGSDPYSFTAGILAWAACGAVAERPHPAGALGPVQAFGASALERGCATAGIRRQQPETA